VVQVVVVATSLSVVVWVVVTVVPAPAVAVSVTVVVCPLTVAVTVLVRGVSMHEHTVLTKEAACFCSLDSDAAPPACLLISRVRLILGLGEESILS